MIFIFCVILFALICIEKTIYKTYVTPFNMLAAIYMIAIISINTFGKLIGFKVVEKTTIFWFLVFLIIAFCADLIFKILNMKAKRVDDNIIGDFHSRVINKARFIEFLFLICLVAYGLSLLMAISQFGLTGTKGKSSGIFAHIGILGVAISPYILLMFVDLRSKRYFVEIVALYAIMVMFGGKYEIFFALIASTFLLIQNNKINLKKIIPIFLKVVTLGGLFFILIYAVLPMVLKGETSSGSTSVLEGSLWALRHMLFYFFGPFISANSFFDMPMHAGLGEGLRAIFNPLVRIIELFGDKNYPNIVSDNWVHVSTIDYCNVGGLFSEAVYYIDFLGALVYFYIISFFVGFCNYIVKTRGKYVVSTAIVMAAYVLSFFSNYFILLSIIEMMIYAYLFESIIYSKKEIVIKFGNVVIFR